MTIEQLRKAHRAQPFHPFTIRLADGRAYLVRHPEYLSQSESGRTIIVHHDYEDWSVIDLLLVTELEFHASSDSPGAAA